MFETILENVQQKTPLVHCITNYVTVNDCANIVLACGGSPIMADEEEEVEDITSICSATVINIGTLNRRTLNSMIRAGRRANELGRPVILDPVGAGASRLRNEAVEKLLDAVNFSVIRGNASEIRTVYAGSGTTQGVDADAGDAVTEQNLEANIQFAKTLSRQTGAVVAVTGAIDLIADEWKAYICRNGHPDMSKITGSGCMLTSVIGAFCGANPDKPLDAAAAAVAAMGVCGQLAAEKVRERGTGTGSMRTYLIDCMSRMDAAMLNGGIRLASK